MSIRKKISEASEECGVSREYVIHFIQEEWVTPRESEYLDEEDLARIRLINELRDEFGVNDEGVSIILHLIDQLNCLRLEMRHHE